MFLKTTHLKHLAIGLLCALTLVGCTGVSTIAAPQSQPTLAVALSTSIEVPIATQDNPVEGVKPTPRTDMAATDPSTVTLASGKPLLVEFFAFW